MTSAQVLQGHAAETLLGRFGIVRASLDQHMAALKLLMDRDEEEDAADADGLASEGPAATAADRMRGI